MPTIKFEDLARDSTTSFTPKLYDNRRVSDPWLGFNKNIYTPWQHRKEGLGLYSTINGELDKNNLHDNFLIQKQHIMPEQAVIARMESLRDSCTIYGRSSDGLSEQDTYPAEAEGSEAGDFFTVPGLSLRWYQAYDASAALAQWSFFLSWNNWMGRFKDVFRSSWAQGVFTEISLRCLVDGKVIEGTNRRLGENFFHPVSPGAPNQQTAQMYGPGLDSFGGDEASYSSSTDFNGAGNPKYCFPEAHSATYFDLHSLLSTEHLKKGYHEISVQCSIRSLKDANGEKPGPVFIQNVGKQVQWSDKDSHQYKLRGHFTLVGKVSFGVRNARVVSFL
tara:strand:+ start:7127 stop:8125 length:999 start_codon:yes stop_codon:yes gene_type:complete